MSIPAAACCINAHRASHMLVTRESKFAMATTRAVEGVLANIADSRGSIGAAAATGCTTATSVS